MTYFSEGKTKSQAQEDTVTYPKAIELSGVEEGVSVSMCSCWAHLSLSRPQVVNPPRRTPCLALGANLEGQWGRDPSFTVGSLLVFGDPAACSRGTQTGHKRKRDLTLERFHLLTLRTHHGVYCSHEAMDYKRNQARESGLPHWRKSPRSAARS